MRIWTDKGKSFNAFGFAPFFAVVNSKYVLTMVIFGLHIGYSKSLGKFL